MKTYRKRAPCKRKKHRNNTVMASTKNAVKQTRIRVKKRLLSFLHKTKKSIKRASIKVNTTIAKKIRGLTKRRVRK
jgi:hypothetical protein